MEEKTEEIIHEESKHSKMKKGILIISLTLILLFIIPLTIYYFFIRDFYVKEENKIIEIPVLQPFQAPKIQSCYGNIFLCKEPEAKYLGEELDTSKVQEYKVKYLLTYQKKEKEIDVTIKVVDKESPNIEISQEMIHVCPDKTTFDANPQATDTYDGDLTDQIMSSYENDQVEFKVTDSSGNTTSKSVPATIEDNTFPTITLSGDKVLYIPLNTAYQEPGYTAEDNCDGDLTDQVVVEKNINTQEAGEYRIHYSVKDSSENITTTERIVYVYSKQNSVTPSGKNIYLTFDDGPSIYTDHLLDILKKYNVKATFFVTNSGPDEAITRAYKEGHSIALHTATHNYRTVYQSEESYWNDLYAVQARVKNLTGYESRLVRFPGGSSNTVSNFNPGIMSRLANQILAKGYQYFDWNVDSNDAGGATTSAQVANNVIKYLGSGSAYIVLQHDIKKFSVDAVETIIQYGLSHGYNFQPLTITSPTAHHRINN